MTSIDFPQRIPRSRLFYIGLVALILILFAAYLYNLTGWQIFDDEGEYLYQVWRMTLGEAPYRDFLTPQLPLFLYGGTLVMEMAGVALFPMRLYSVLLAFGSGLLLLVAGWRHANPLVGALALLLFLAHPDVFREMRIFRNEPTFIFFVTAGLTAATWSWQKPKASHLVVSGALFGMAALAKLFGLLPAVGVALWLTWHWWNDRRPFSELVKTGVLFGLPLLAVVGLTFGAFLAFEPTFLDLVLGHHLAQGSDLSLIQVFINKLRLYFNYWQFYPVLVSIALISAVTGFKRKDARLPWLFQLPTVLAFLVISRQFGQRHFMYLLPALCLLAAWLIDDGLRGHLWTGNRYRRLIPALSALLVLFILVPAVRANHYRAQWHDTETDELVSIIEEHTEPGDVILADDIGLAYYARRPTTYSGAALSHGAVTSGQITTEILIDEIVADDVRMVLVDTSLLTGNHMVFLHDYPGFHRFLERNYEYLGNVSRDYQEVDIWWREGNTPFATEDRITIDYEDGTQFGPNMRLLGYNLSSTTLGPGETLAFTLFWQAETPAQNYWSVFAHLIGPDGNLVAQQDKVPYDGVYPPNRWHPGVIVDDDYAITLPPDAPEGEYHIVIGMYDWQTGERLPLSTPSGEPLANHQVQLQQSIQVQTATGS
jgi:4-amino-4-deoxy-L-arabinose transferase-like glycosyltransferase